MSGKNGTENLGFCCDGRVCMCPNTLLQGFTLRGGRTFGATDLAGNPRTVNGSRMDIGCYEADRKARYASDLGSRLSVVETSPAVYETDSRTVLRPKSVLSSG